MKRMLAVWPLSLVFAISPLAGCLALSGAETLGISSFDDEDEPGDIDDEDDGDGEDDDDDGEDDDDDR